MPQTKEMPIEQKLAICAKARKMKAEGNEKESMRIMTEELPMPSYLAKWAKKRLGADFLINGGWNLNEANAEFGPDWLKCNAQDTNTLKLGLT
jgi:hypothetical protein